MMIRTMFNNVDKWRGDIRQQPNAIVMMPISCLMSPSVALTSKSRRTFAVVKFANIYQVRHYKTTFPCREFVDTKLFYQDHCDRPSQKNKKTIKEET